MVVLEQNSQRRQAICGNEVRGQHLTRLSLTSCHHQCWFLPSSPSKLSCINSLLMIIFSILFSCNVGTSIHWGFPVSISWVFIFSLFARNTCIHCKHRGVTTLLQSPINAMFCCLQSNPKVSLGIAHRYLREQASAWWQSTLQSTWHFRHIFLFEAYISWEKINLFWERRVMDEINMK